MPNFRSKASEIKAAGEAERGNFTPGGVPKRMYNYWLSRTGSKKGEAIREGSRRENFCHFWRVVLFWAPLFGLGSFLMNLLESKVFLGTAVAAIVGAIVLLAFSSDGFADFLSVVGLVILIVVAVAAIIGTLTFLHQKFWNSDWNDYALYVLMGVFAVYFVGVAIFGLVAWVSNSGWLMVIATLIGVLLAGAFVVFLGSKASDYISGRRALAKKRASARTDAWLNDEITDDEYFGRTPKKAPGRVAKFFSGVGDFIILIAQVVRVKKWKICPMVEVDTKA